MGKGSACMTDQYNIEIQRPVRARRGDSKLIVVVTDGLGKELFRDRADLNEEKSRTRVAKGIAGITGDTAEAIAGRLLDNLGHLPPPASPVSRGRAIPGGQSAPYPYEATEARSIPTDRGRHLQDSGLAITSEIDRITVPVNNRFMREITADAIEALGRTNDPPRIFCRGTALVRLMNEEDSLSAEPLNSPALKGELDRSADFVKIKTRNNGDVVEQVREPSRPPQDVVNDILSQPRLPFPVLSGFATTPIFLPGGILLDMEGHDPGSGIYLRLRGLGGVRSDLSLDDARNLLVNELLVDFPFAEQASQANAIALLLLPFIRPLITGATPLHLFDAPTRGTGKGLLADVISVVATGSPAHVMSLPRDDDELEKRITAALLAGRQVIHLDNVRRLESPSLEAVLTTTLWEGRRLGKSEMVRAPNNATWLATGNNVEMSDEMNRRTVLIRLDAGVEAPEERSGFKHPLPAWAIEHRGDLVSACLSIVMHWIDAGKPRSDANLGRFEEWAAVMGGVLGVSGVSGFLGNRGAQRVQDSESREWVVLCQAWWEMFEALPVTAKDVLSLARYQNLLLEYWGGRKDLGAQQRIGAALGKRRDRIFGRYRIRPASTGATGGNAYRLEKIEVGDKTPKTPETPSDLAAGQNSPRLPDTKSGVLGVSGVLVGDGSDDGPDVMVVD